MADFIYIDGVEYKPDKELIEKIKEFLSKKATNSFDKVAFGEDYFFIGDEGVVHKERHTQTCSDTNRYRNGNYCTNYSYIVSRAKEENLMRRMWRFSLENNGDKIDWGDNHQEKYYLWVDVNEVKINKCTIAHYLGQVYFISREVVEKAKEIFEKEIIEVYGA